jgi:hypothetical protein
MNTVSPFQSMERAVTKPRKMKIMKKYLKHYGYTPGCNGCIESEAGRGPRGHSPECRERFEKLLSNDLIKVEADERAKCYREAHEEAGGEEHNGKMKEPYEAIAIKSDQKRDDKEHKEYKLAKTIRSTVAKATNTKKKYVQVDVNINIVDKRIPGKWLLHGTRTDRTNEQ